jgi:hypothetical protein
MLRKALTPALCLLAVLLGWLAWRNAGERAVAIEQARQAALASRAAIADAREQRAAAETLRAERDAYRQATDEATRKATAATARASGAVRTALDALSDSAATPEDLRGHIRDMAAAWVADSIAQAQREAAWLARALNYERVIAADSLAIKTVWDALAAEQRAHAATKAIPRKSLLATVGPYVVVGAAAYLAGALDIP